MYQCCYESLDWKIENKQRDIPADNVGTKGRIILVKRGDILQCTHNYLFLLLKSFLNYISMTFLSLTGQTNVAHTAYL